MRHQRHRRAGRQCGAGRDRHGAQGAPRCDGVRHRHRHEATCPALEARFERHGLSGAVQQGHCRQERLRPRIGHPSGRHAQERRDLRDHAARRCGREGDVARAGQALRPPRLPRQAREPGLRAGRHGLRTRRSAGSRNSPTRKSTYSTTISWRSWTTKFSAGTTASPSKP